jgi:hypothetical protein
MISRNEDQIVGEALRRFGTPGKVALAQAALDFDRSAFWVTRLFSQRVDLTLSLRVVTISETKLPAEVDLANTERQTDGNQQATAIKTAIVGSRRCCG